MQPNGYFAITGYNIDSVRIAKKAFRMSLRKVTKFSIMPFALSLQLETTTIDNLPLELSASFSIGPEDTPNALRAYASLLIGQKNDPASPSEISEGGRMLDVVRCGVLGETREIISGMKMDEILKDHKMFKRKIIAKVQEQLPQFGLKMYAPRSPYTFILS